jgi:hypothetical protein
MPGDHIEGWVKVEGVWWRSPMPPHVAKRLASKQEQARYERDEQGDPTDRCPPNGPWCGACRKEHVARPEHPRNVCGFSTSVLRRTCVSCDLKQQAEERWG